MSKIAVQDVYEALCATKKRLEQAKLSEDDEVIAEIRREWLSLHTIFEKCEERIEVSHGIKRFIIAQLEPPSPPPSDSA